MDETPIEIVEYDPDWPERFEAERERLALVLDEYTARIEHVGSTSVPGLGAKPIVDVTAVVTDVDGLWGDLDKLGAGLGYRISHVPGDWLLLQRTDDAGNAYNLHLIRDGDEQWRHDLLFREFLRSNPDVRDEYEAVKREAARAHRDDIDGYNEAKGAFCASVLRRAIDDESVTIPDPSPSE